MASRDPLTLQQLTADHLRAAAGAWTGRYGTFGTAHDWDVILDGCRYPTKPIVALAHQLAGLGVLTPDTLAGRAARRRLQALGFALVNGDAAATALEAEKDAPAATPERLQRRHVEAAIAEFDGYATGDTGGVYVVRDRPHQTEWHIGLGERWYPWLKLLYMALGRAGCLELGYPPIRPGDYGEWRARVEELGFPVKRGRTPVRARHEPWSSADLRAAAAALIGTTEDAPSSEPPGADPLQVVIDGVAYPAAALLGLAPGVAPSEQERAAIVAAGAALRAAPDPLDAELEALAASATLSTEARREVTARVGQGRFRAALLLLHGGCAVTGIAVREVLRAAHIHRWADCADTPAERLDPDNGLLLTANLDCLFEAGLIAFDDHGGVLLSPALDGDTQARLGVHADMRLAAAPSAGQQGYLAKHRERTSAMRRVT
ncbi:HNH endonuclease (plasmid) [Cupriavidus basilensis]